MKIIRTELQVLKYDNYENHKLTLRALGMPCSQSELEQACGESKIADHREVAARRLVGRFVRTEAVGLIEPVSRPE